MRTKSSRPRWVLAGIVVVVSLAWPTGLEAAEPPDVDWGGLEAQLKTLEASPGLCSMEPSEGANFQVKMNRTFRVLGLSTGRAPARMNVKGHVRLARLRFRALDFVIERFERGERCCHGCYLADAVSLREHRDRFAQNIARMVAVVAPTLEPSEVRALCGELPKDVRRQWLGEICPIVPGSPPS